ncbi:hypothetical protein [Coralloluteibacterium stylophorae]|uniref:Uncharacterized protein n=1 Tax=Coralloluteibacterium stylophorae TaxID=1776034 RepID=A0A8J7VUQ4_9GAMM|nr:hypothetical protein [Coralloluteibacterium stylophorae]MBS7458003.1 hypothetical protein [Coralloluteibacterium stylophorae]
METRSGPTSATPAAAATSKRPSTSRPEVRSGAEAPGPTPAPDASRSAPETADGSARGGDSGGQGITPEQALANTRALLEQKHAAADGSNPYPGAPQNDAGAHGSPAAAIAESSEGGAPPSAGEQGGGRADDHVGPASRGRTLNRREPE